MPMDNQPMDTQQTGEDLYAFEITLHGLPAGAVGMPKAAAVHVDAWGSWPAIVVSQHVLTEPMMIGFDDCLARLEQLERMFVEPDGAIVWTSPRSSPWWQVDGNLVEKDGRVLLVDLKGSCPAAAFDLFLTAFGWPAQGVVVQLVRSARFLDESTFRQHARCRAVAGDAQTLRPD